MKWKPSQKGAAAVEFAILSLLLLVFVFGIIEFGLLWVQSHYIANAAREGARVAAKLEDPDGDDEATVQTAIQNYLEGSVVYSTAFVSNCCDSGDNVEISVDPETITAAGVDPIDAWRVTVTVQSHEIYEPVLWNLLNLLPGVDLGEITQITQSAVFAAQP
jgi:Flp pilus assembly protein TadG